MKTMTKAERITNARANHANWLISLGADRDEAQRGITYRRLKTLDRRADRINTQACNGELEYDEAADGYPEQERILWNVTKEVQKLFGGVLPVGFEINRDPRGYALKINDEVLRDQYYTDLRNQGINPYTDFGGYGILAPDFN